jgi:alanine racemase
MGRCSQRLRGSVPTPAMTAATCPVSAAAAGAVLTIDLGAIADNYRRLQARLGAVPAAAVVKADAYGLGAADVAPALAAEGCRHFFVAQLAEGMALRAALGPGAVIYILNGLPPGAEPEAVAHDLQPVLNGLGQIDAWRKAAEHAGRPLAAALQVDSGMSRLGLAPAEVTQLAERPGRLSGIAVSLVMSHLACADEPDNPANALQREAFEALRRRLPAAPASLANGSGVFLDRAFHFDLARPGAALYGINPTPGKANPMRPVVGLAAKVVQTRSLPGAGVGVGYGYAFRSAGALPLATIALGYADGWPRAAATAAFVDGVRLPFAGRVSMDLIVLDVSALPPGRLKEGDMVELLCEQQDVDAVAAAAGTIGYEVLTGLGRRFHRQLQGRREAGS